ncbi:3-isopropylmalate dehydratase small subunit [Roseomonas hellenica]|uniref:3-isopropylmalate dehydratase small subunit n=1 Tax=Plastoroseomonas hellenica TaxID=2687306 RepID=A0ABS5EW79_9PROT|nr:3-isopropylmalate dehydratase small subunit [Plastoroseomonas hellenica]MBR0664534.1 3-isopropylmalate dehydratase small subunit [Plastoroseomonas hellenica]
MEPFVALRSAAVPFARPNIDTDQILPARYLSRPRDDNHGAYLFRDLRLATDGSEVPDFPLNQPHWRDARIALGGRNFACGSSRENAVWAFYDHGVRAVIAPSFGDIFANNAVKNGMLAVTLPAADVATLIAQVQADPAAEIAVDLPSQTVTGPDGATYRFEIDPFAKKCLLEGLDEIAFTLNHAEEIAAFERRLGRDNY